MPPSVARLCVVLLLSIQFLFRFWDSGWHETPSLSHCLGSCFFSPLFFFIVLVKWQCLKDTTNKDGAEMVGGLFLGYSSDGPHKKTGLFRNRLCMEWHYTGRATPFGEHGHNS